MEPSNNVDIILDFIKTMSVVHIKSQLIFTTLQPQRSAEILLSSAPPAVF